MSAHRPHAATATDMLLSLLLDELEGQAQVLQEIRDRLPKPVMDAAIHRWPSEPVEVSEPAPPARPGVRPESSPGGVGDGVVPVDEPAPPATPGKSTSKKTPSRRRT